MTGPIGTVTARDNRRRSWEDWLAGPMFFLSLLFLVVLAGLIHRWPHLQPGELEAYLIEGCLGALWLLFFVEAIIRFSLRDRSRRPWRPLLGAVMCVLVPPVRMGLQSQVRPNHIWLLGLGWQEITSRLRRTLERFFSVPMVVFALMVVPLLVIEYFEAEKIHASPALALGLDISTSLIWLAFAIELIVMVAVSDRPVRYCFFHWIDVVIVLLPAIEMLPLLRLLRLGRILRLEQLLRWGRLSRLQGLLARGWRAFLLLQIVQRLTGHSLERRLKQLQDLLQAKEEEVADLRREIQELQERIAQKAVRAKTAAA
jgi:voltage-gated potassium channel